MERETFNFGSRDYLKLPSIGFIFHRWRCRAMFGDLYATLGEIASSYTAISGRQLANNAFG